MRKKYFNQMEDMKGKIRVYARVRPMLEFERSRGQKEALIIPDELSLEHMWKDKKREFSFDAVFSPATTQEKVVSHVLVVVVVLLQDLVDFVAQDNFCWAVSKSACLLWLPACL